ncbi:Cof-type HAD-IIB family hydrolase [Mycoplasmopsis cynos]|nr:Cof-type HAD-IIB family hydrolase [Mycoplasmopsis cynos]WQQ13372.1 Cof-type HAD-IIB family hydrolase [Mycoplasmopsis cynos]WQQ13648.1 Cof-type HAD-IIB family hydrolase [Mycoplasmopsis cynos]
MDKINKINDKYLDSIFFDLDGTLLNSQKQITEKTLLCIKKLQAKGKKVGIITGRPYFFAKYENHLINADFPLIGCNGALIYDFKKNEIIYKNPINKNATIEIFDKLIKNNITFLLYTTEEIFGFYSINEYPNWFNWLNNSINKLPDKFKFKFNAYKYKFNENDFEIQQFDIIKILVIVSDSDLTYVHSFCDELRNIKGIYTIKSQSNVIDIMPNDCSKGEALNMLSKIQNIDLNKTIVFGDEHNDISMFNVSKYSVAMGQANLEIKNAATFITLSNNDDGIYDFFEKIN